MAITTPQGIDLQAPEPLELKSVKATITDRNNISLVTRYEGLRVYVSETKTNYQLQNGITDGDWVTLGVMDYSQLYTKVQLQTPGESVVNWANLSNVPPSFPPSAHTHVSASITDLSTTLATFYAAQSIGGLFDVSLNTLHNNDYLKYNGTKWINSQNNITWGNVTGTLSDQLDLQSALNNKKDNFSENTAFNKNFGVGYTDVARGNHIHSAATQLIDGFLSATDKTKLDGISSGATVYTDKEAQDAVGNILTNTAGNVVFTYDTITPKITANVTVTKIDVKTAMAGDYESFIRILSTGIKSGGTASQNISHSNQFDIAAGTATFVDTYTDINNPILVHVAWNSIIGIICQYLTTDTTTYVRIDKNGTITQSPNTITEDERRDLVEIAWIDHPDNTTLSFFWQQPDTNINLQNQLNDFFVSFGQFNINGNEYTAGSTNLTIQRSAGQTFDANSNYPNDIRNPHVFTNNLENPCQIYYYYQDGSVDGWKNDNTAVTNIDPNHYNNGTGLSSVTAGYWTIQLISFYDVYEANDIQYGQAQYATYADALANLKTPVIINPYNSSDTFRAWLIVKQGATNLADPSQAIFRSGGKYGLNDAGSGSIGGTGGEVNTASNVGLAGIGFYLVKSGVNLQFKNLNASSIFSLTDNVGNKTIDLGFTGDTTHRLVTDSQISIWTGKQDTLVSGTNIKTINGTSLLGSGDITVQTPLGFTPENITNKSTNVTTDAASDVKYPSVKAVKTYADSLVLNLLNDRGSYNASSNLYPSTGGSGTAGAILKGNLWYISVAGTLGGVLVSPGDTIRALVDSPGQTASNWDQMENNVGYTPENVLNKDTSNGYVGLTLYAHNFWNAAKTYLTTVVGTATTSRTINLPDNNGTIALLSDIVPALPPLTTNYIWVGVANVPTETPISNIISAKGTLISGQLTITDTSITTNSFAIVTMSTVGISTDVPIKFTANVGSMLFSTGQTTDTCDFGYIIFV